MGRPPKKPIIWYDDFLVSSGELGPTASGDCQGRMAPGSAIPWRGLHRHQYVGWPQAEAACLFRVSRATAAKWVHLSRDGGPDAFHDRSSRPRRSPRQTNQLREAAISGAHGAIDPNAAIPSMFDYVDAGFTTWDLADHYGPAEDFVGEFRRRLASARGGEAVSGIQAFTKWVPRPGPMTRQVVENNIDISRRRMGMDRLNLLQFHWWDYRESAYLEALTHLSDLRDEGKIQELALTNFDTQRMQEIAGQGIRVVSNQVQYSLVDRRPEVAMVGFCQSHEVSAAGLRDPLRRPAVGPVPGPAGTDYCRFEHREPAQVQADDRRLGRLEPISAVAGRAQGYRRQAQRQHRQRRGAICPGPSRPLPASSLAPG